MVSTSNDCSTSCHIDQHWQIFLCRWQLLPHGPSADVSGRCPNPKCICNCEHVEPRIRLTDDGTARCGYCDAKIVLK